jgi:two-component system, response regulator, stage 0 sporulation protein A
MRENRIKVLVVDDNKEFANILSDYLEQTVQFEIVGKASNGIEALELICSMDMDLVILDLIMPRLDGIGVLEELNAMKLDHKPKIVVLSAVANDRITQSALSIGADYYVTKPFNMDSFANRVKELFGHCDGEDVEEHGAASKIQNEQNQPVNVDIEVEISEFLHKLGIPVHIKGYLYLKSAITMAFNDMSALSGMTTVIYPTTAAVYNTTGSRVERAIRHAIESATSNKRNELWEKLFVNKSLNKKSKPTNGEFIGTVADAIRLKIKREA